MVSSVRAGISKRLCVCKLEKRGDDEVLCWLALATLSHTTTQGKKVPAIRAQDGWCNSSESSSDGWWYQNMLLCCPLSTSISVGLEMIASTRQRKILMVRNVSYTLNIQKYFCYSVYIMMSPSSNFCVRTFSGTCRQVGWMTTSSSRLRFDHPIMMMMMMIVAIVIVGDSTNVEQYTKVK